MIDNDYLQFLKAEETEVLSDYAAPYDQNRQENIQDRFYQSLKKTKGRRTRWLFAAVAAVLLCTSIAWASGITIEKLYQMVFGDGIEYLNGHDGMINKSCISDGIEVKVISAIHEEEMMYLFFSVKDLEGKRLNEEMELSCSIDKAREHGVKLLSFDQVEQEAVYLAEIHTFRDDGEMEFRVDCIEFGWEMGSKIHSEIDFYALLKDVDLTLIRRASDKFDEQYGYRVRDIKIPLDGLSNAYLEEICYESDQKRLTLRAMYYGEMNEISDVLLINKQMQPISETEWFNPADQGRDQEVYSQMIYLDNITSISEMKDTILEYRQVKHDVSWGDWAISFKTPEKTGQIPLDITEVQIDQDVYAVEKAVLTPVGITIRYKVVNENDFVDEKDMRAVVIYQDGRKEVLTEPYATRGVWTDGMAQTLHITGNVIDINSVKAVEISGEVIPIQQ